MRFVGGPWTPETKAGTFARFFEAHAGLDRAAFLEKVRHPHLVIGLDLDPRAWDRGIVVRLEKKLGEPEPGVTVGRDPEADVTLNCPTMSKFHARFTREGDAWFVTDLRSSKGTVVDGAPAPREQKTALASERPVIELGPDVKATFFRPEQLHAVVNEALERRRAGPVPAPSGPAVDERWPTWALLQEPVRAPTQHELPAYVPPAEGAPKPKLEVRDRPARTWKRQVRELVANPRRILFTLVVIFVVIVCFQIYGRPLAFMIFSNSHPEWFR